jgi:molecular chaperone GrpE
MVRPEEERTEEAAVTAASEEPMAADGPTLADEAAAATDDAPGENGGEPAAAEAVQTDLDELTARAEKADEYLALAQRTRADFENYRKRTVRDLGLAEARGTGKLAKSLLPALDALEAALDGAAEDDGPFVAGIRGVQQLLQGSLEQAGVSAFRPEVGEPFDPQQHEAISQLKMEGVESGAVGGVSRTGYRLGETVLRPAQVVVGG